MQEKSEEKYSFSARLKKLRVIRQLKWVEVASLLELSEAMVYKIISGGVGMSDKSVFRLEKLEREAGIETPPREPFFVTTLTDEDRVSGDLAARTELIMQALKDLEGRIAEIKKLVRPHPPKTTKPQ